MQAGVRTHSLTEQLQHRNPEAVSAHMGINLDTLGGCECAYGNKFRHLGPRVSKFIPYAHSQPLDSCAVAAL